MNINQYPYSIDKLFTYDEKKIKNNLTILQKIQKQTLILLKLNQLINISLPVILRPWCRVINVRKEIIVLETINANWKMRLYYEKIKMLSVLKTIIPLLFFIKIKINSNFTKTKKLNITVQNDNNHLQNFSKIKSFSQILTLQSTKHILKITKYSGKKLKNTLERLVKHIEKNIKYF